MNLAIVPTLLSIWLGDYMLQPKWVATKKSSDIWVCIYHGLVFTLMTWISFLICSVTVTFWFLLLVFVTHVLIDKYAIGQWWLDLIKGRNWLEESCTKGVHKDIQVSFAVVVYVIVDNGMHFFSMLLLHAMTKG